MNKKDKFEFNNVKKKNNSFEKIAERNFEHLKYKLDAHNSFQNLITTRDDQKFRYSIDIFDPVLSLTTTIFVVTLGGYITSLSLKDVNFVNISYLKSTLLITAFISILIWCVIFILRYFKIKEINETINKRTKTLCELAIIENEVADNFHKDRQKVEEINGLVSGFEKT